MQQNEAYQIVQLSRIQDLIYTEYTSEFSKINKYRIQLTCWWVEVWKIHIASTLKKLLNISRKSKPPNPVAPESLIRNSEYTTPQQLTQEFQDWL